MNEDFNYVVETKPAVTLRQWYAGIALIGLCANPNNSGHYEEFAEHAYGHADAMIAHEKKEKEEK